MAAQSFRHRRHVSTFVRYLVLILVGVVMIYPLLWMVSASFKASNNDIFGNMNLIPQQFTLDGYRSALGRTYGNLNIVTAILNTLLIVVCKVIFTVISSTLTAYGFGRFEFKGKGFFFALLMSTLFLPQVVLNVPQFLMYTQLGWVDSPLYLPLILPTLFATETYFVFLLIQFLRSVPQELDEAAKIDGCSALQTLLHIIVPVLMPAIVSVALFQFMWSSNDFMGPLLYINTPARYTATLFTRLNMDPDAGFEYNGVLALSLISLIPSLIVFFLAQRQFVDGISAGSVKG